MIIRTLQWNIGGGKVRKTDDNPIDPLSYCIDDLDSFIDLLKKHTPDIITIQESHSNKTDNQANKIADALGYKYFINDVYDSSHLEKGMSLNQAIISVFPIKNSEFELFFNPKFETLGPRGEHWVSHEKGISSCLIEIEKDKVLQIKTSHSFPYRRFHIDPLSKETLQLRNDMVRKIKPSNDLFLYQGDLNLDFESLQEVLPDLLVNGMNEVILEEFTTPKGKKYDHVLYKGIKHVSSKIITDVLSDHYPVISEFEL